MTSKRPWPSQSHVITAASVNTMAQPLTALGNNHDDVLELQASFKSQSFSLRLLLKTPVSAPSCARWAPLTEVLRAQTAQRDPDEADKCRCITKKYDPSCESMKDSSFAPSHPLNPSLLLPDDTN